MSHAQQPADRPDPRLTDIEAALGSLSPSPGRFDRDHMMFLAGQAARRPSSLSRWAWPAIAAGLAVVAAVEGALLASRPEPRVVERLVVVREPPPPAPPQTPAPAVAESPEGPAPVKILRSSPLEGERPLADAPPGATGSSYADLRRRVLRLGIDALPEPPPLPMATRLPVDRPAPSGRLLRAEIERLLNPGESS